jgi:hypothetical protein
VLVLEAEVAPARGGAALKAMDEVLRLVAAGPGDRELAWARSAVKLSFARATSSVWPSLALASEAALHDLSIDDLRSYPQRIDGTDAAAVRAVLSDCVGHTASTYLGPRTELPGIPWQEGSALHAEIVAAL